MRQSTALSLSLSLSRLSLSLSLSLSFSLLSLSLSLSSLSLTDCVTRRPRCASHCRTTYSFPVASVSTGKLESVTARPETRIWRSAVTGILRADGRTGGRAGDGPGPGRRPAGRAGAGAGRRGRLGARRRGGARRQGGPLRVTPARRGGGCRLNLTRMAPARARRRQPRTSSPTAETRSPRVARGQTSTRNLNPGPSPTVPMVQLALVPTGSETESMPRPRPRPGGPPSASGVAGLLAFGPGLDPSESRWTRRRRPGRRPVSAVGVAGVNVRSW